MKFSKPLALAIFISAFSLLLTAQDRGTWTSKSSNARAITGDVILTDANVAINYLLFPIAHVRTLTPDELRAAFDADPGGAGNLYRLNVPASQRFQHKNTLCGTEDTIWMATYVQGRSLTIDFFSTTTPPVFTFEALNNSSDLCGTFTYSR